MQDGGPRPDKHTRRGKPARTRDEVRSLLHEFYIEIATTKMSKEKFEEFVDRVIEATIADERK